MSSELDDPKVLARLGLALLIGIAAAIAGLVFAMLMVPLFVAGWEVFFWIELSALVFGIAGSCWGWRWLTKRNKMQGSPT